MNFSVRPKRKEPYRRLLSAPIAPIHHASKGAASSDGWRSGCVERNGENVEV